MSWSVGKPVIDHVTRAEIREAFQRVPRGGYLPPNIRVGQRMIDHVNSTRALKEPSVGLNPVMRERLNDFTNRNFDRFNNLAFEALERPHTLRPRAPVNPNYVVPTAPLAGFARRDPSNDEGIDIARRHCRIVAIATGVATIVTLIALIVLTVLFPPASLAFLIGIPVVSASLLALGITSIVYGANAAKIAYAAKILESHS